MCRARFPVRTSRLSFSTGTQTFAARPDNLQPLILQPINMELFDVSGVVKGPPVRFHVNLWGGNLQVAKAKVTRSNDSSRSPKPRTASSRSRSRHVLRVGVKVREASSLRQGEPTGCHGCDHLPRAGPQQADEVAGASGCCLAFMDWTLLILCRKGTFPSHKSLAGDKPSGSWQGGAPALFPEQRETQEHAGGNAHLQEGPTWQVAFDAPARKQAAARSKMPQNRRAAGGKILAVGEGYASCTAIRGGWNRGGGQRPRGMSKILKMVRSQLKLH